MSAESLISTLLTGTVGAVSVLVVILALILIGKLHTDGELKREIAMHDKDVEREVQAHNLTRKALDDMTKAFQAATDRVDNAVKVSELVTEAFTKAAQRSRRSGSG